jgi:cytochrome c-type biogenesis protein
MRVYGNQEVTKSLKLALLALSILLSFLVFSPVANSYNRVVVEFFYRYDSNIYCPECGRDLETERATEIIREIEIGYGDSVVVDVKNIYFGNNLEQWKDYNFTRVPALVINGTYTMERTQIDAGELRRIIDALLRGEKPSMNPSEPLLSATLAFSLGLFSGLSPCLMAMLGFILSYTSGTVSSFKSGMFRVSIFGIGFISALLLIGALFAAVLMWIPSFTTTMMWAASVLMILVGLNLVGLLPVPSGLRSFGQKLGSRGRVELAQRYRATTIGLFSLGFIFYFVSICTAPLSFTVLPTLSAPNNIYLLPLFGIGALLPFLVVGIVAGGSPALAKRIGQQHRRKIRAFSGVILLAYSIWVIVFHLLL